MGATKGHREDGRLGAAWQTGSLGRRREEHTDGAAKEVASSVERQLVQAVIARQPDGVEVVEQSSGVSARKGSLVLDALRRGDGRRLGLKADHVAFPANAQLSVLIAAPGEGDAV